MLTFRLLLIETALGRLDVLREVSPVGDFTTLECVDATLLGHPVRVISRHQLITVKRSVGRPKDLEVALELEALEELERSSS